MVVAAVAVHLQQAPMALRLLAAMGEMAQPLVFPVRQLLTLGAAVAAFIVRQQPLELEAQAVAVMVETATPAAQALQAQPTQAAAVVVAARLFQTLTKAAVLEVPAS